VNAWVSNRGGVLGLFPRRILAVGLPLIKILSQGQFRCVLAHEFGHYAGGDTRLGPWIYKTHAAIQRTLEMLEGNDSIWRFPFMAYGRLFTRMSLAVSQQQELAADALASRIGGGKLFAEALRLIEGAGDAFPGYIGDELLPVLNAGFRPPFSEGFQRFLSAKPVTRYVSRRVGHELSTRKRDPFRTHPPLYERLESLAALSPGVAPAVDPPALELLEEQDALEAELLSFITENPKIRKLPVLGWDEVGEKAFLPAWRERAKEIGAPFAPLRPEELPDVNLTTLGRTVEKKGSDAEARSAAMTSIGIVLTVWLRDRGWRVSMDPGERVTVTKGEHRIEPMHLYIDLAEGKLTRDSWRERCRSAGIEGKPLGEPAPTA
jgi:heat shock protein HtpX